MDEPCQRWCQCRLVEEQEVKERCEGRIPSQANVTTWRIDWQEINWAIHTLAHMRLIDRWDTDACYVKGPLRPGLINPIADRAHYIQV